MKKILTVLLLAVFAAAAVFGCSKKDGSPSTVPAGGNASVSSGQASSAVSGPVSPSSAPASSDGASAAPTGPASSQNGPVLDIQTDSSEFDAKFKKNPVDKSYVSESAAAVSNIDMVKVSDKYAALWQKEIDRAWSELQKYKYPEELKTEQQKWENGKSAALRKIASDAQAAGGTMAQVDSSSQIMDFYRSRANRLYRELYNYDRNYTYAFQSK